MKNLLVLVTITATAAFAGGCKKDKGGDSGGGGGTAAQPTGSGTAAQPTGSGTAAEPAGSGSAATPDPAAEADYFKVVADHADASKGPVDVVFSGVKVVKASFDPAKIEGGTATLEVELGTLSTGIDKRDGHLKSPDFFDVAKFPTMTIDIANVKKAGDKSFTADAKVKLHGVEKTYPVTFDVIESTADSIKVRGEHKLSRLDFGVGQKESPEGQKEEVVAKLQVTIKKT